MKMATGLIEPNAGEILFEGRRIKENLMAYRQRMGYVSEELSKLPEQRPWIPGNPLMLWKLVALKENRVGF